MPKALAKGRRDLEKDKKHGHDSSDPNSSSPSSSSPRINLSPPSLLSDSNDWQKLTKVARRWSPGNGSGEPAADESAMSSMFRALGPLGGAMKLGLVDDSSLHDLVMIELGAQYLKRARNPPKIPNSSSPSPSPSKSSSPLASAAIDPVSPTFPYMTGAKEEGCIKHEALLLRAKAPSSSGVLSSSVTASTLSESSVSGCVLEAIGRRGHVDISSVTYGGEDRNDDRGFFVTI